MEVKQIKPFVKWAGGKTQLLPTLKEFYPKQLKDGSINTYVEPFVGAGAVLFYVLQNFPNIKKAIICDVNKHLINAWRCIQKNVNKLILLLKDIEKRYFACSDENKAKFFETIRKEFNLNKITSVRNYLSAAQFIFLNKTCFNGLYRVNSKDEFNVPYAFPKNPLICDEENLLLINALLKTKRVKIICGSFEKTREYINSKTFVYFDPPYRPIKFNSFVSYDKSGFNDEDQKKLGYYFKEVSDLAKAYCMLSNSDPKNTNQNDNFFDDLYKEFKINRIFAKRMINSKGTNRGNVSELLITNYE